MRQGVIYIFVFLLSASFVAAQSAVSISSNQDTVLFGDKIDIQLQLRSAELDKIKVLELEVDNFKNLVVDQMQGNGDDFADASVVGRSSSGGIVEIKPDEFGETNALDLSLQMFSLGVFSIKSPNIVLVDGTVIPAFDSIVVFVTAPDYMFQDSTLEIQDIHSIIEIEKTLFEKIKPYLSVLLALAGMALLYYLFTRRKPEEEVVEEVVVEIVDPKVEALERLLKLEDEKPWLTGQEKYFQDEISYIVRNYLERNNDIRALEMTTSEIQSAMKNKGLKLQEFGNDINQLLSIADMVKFAKASPSNEVYASFIEKTKEFIVSVYVPPTAPTEIKK